MVSDLETEIMGEGKECHKTFEEFAEWCEDFEIETGKATRLISRLISQPPFRRSQPLLRNSQQTLKTLADIAADEAGLKKATAIREKEASALLSVAQCCWFCVLACCSESMGNCIHCPSPD